jgi:uncharacterized membrane protein
MGGLNFRTLLFGLGLAANDILMMPFVKKIVGGWPFWTIVFPMLAYALDPLIFYFALKGEGMAIMNLVWNLTSNIVVTLLGVAAFGEIIGTQKTIGIILSFIALFLLTYES